MAVTAVMVMVAAVVVLERRGGSLGSTWTTPFPHKQCGNKVMTEPRPSSASLLHTAATTRVHTTLHEYTIAHISIQEAAAAWRGREHRVPASQRGYMGMRLSQGSKRRESYYRES